MWGNHPIRSNKKYYHYNLSQFIKYIQINIWIIFIFVMLLKKKNKKTKHTNELGLVVFSVQWYDSVGKDLAGYQKVVGFKLHKGWSLK